MTKEIQERGEKLTKEVQELMAKEPDDALRMSVLFTACFIDAAKSGMSPGTFLEFCMNTVAKFTFVPISKGPPS